MRKRAEWRQNRGRIRDTGRLNLTEIWMPDGLTEEYAEGGNDNV